MTRKKERRSLQRTKKWQNRKEKEEDGKRHSDTVERRMRKRDRNSHRVEKGKRGTEPE